MRSKRRVFQRPLGERRYRKLFVIAAEGEKTEPRYFAAFNGQRSVIQVKCLKSRHDSSPRHVLKRMEDYLRQEGLRTSDEAWIVVDRDRWTEEQLSLLHTWTHARGNYGLALSNPKFEYWLLLHFEDGTGIKSVQNCIDRLKRHLPDYDKDFDARKITRQGIEEAIGRARQKDNPPCADWPRAIGGTTVYRLVENILRA